MLVTGFTARLPARLDPPPEPRYRRRTGTEPPRAGRHASREKPGQARMTLSAATAPDAEGRTPARGTQL